MEDELLVVEQAAPLLRLTPAGLRRIIQRGEVKAVKVGKRWLIRRSEIDRVLREGTKPAVTDTSEPVQLAGEGRTLQPEQLRQSKEPGSGGSAMEAAGSGSGVKWQASSGSLREGMRIVG